MQPGSGWPGVEPQPGIPAHTASALLHAMQALWLQVGAGSSAAIVKVVLIPCGKGSTTPSAVAHGGWTQLPDPPPQSASVLQGPNRFWRELVWHSFGPCWASI